MHTFCVSAMPLQRVPSHRPLGCPSNTARCALHSRARHVQWHGRPRALPRGWDDLPPGAQMDTVQEMITFIGEEGVVRIPGRRLHVPRSESSSSSGALRIPQMPTWEEQTLVIGASFAVAATNGRDPARRVSITGFCQSVDLLSEHVEDAVMSRGGEVLSQERELKSGLHERLKLTVFIPFLFGVPPELEALSDAIISGGGIVDRVSRIWGMYRLPVEDINYYY